MGPEAKFYQQIKRNFKQLSLIRIENNSLLGTPDLLVCNTSGNFCTVEIKGNSKGNTRFDFRHTKLPSINVILQNTFIIAKALGPCSSKTSPISMYRGSRISELVALGLKLDACSLGLDACCLLLEQVGSKA